MLDHTESYVEKIHFIDAEVAGHAHELDVKMQRLCGSGKKMGYISLPSILNAIIGITSYQCVVLKMVILHDAIKTIQNEFFLKKNNENLFLLKNKQKTFCLKKKPKETGGLFFFKPGFSQPWH